MVLLFIAFYTSPFSWKHFLLGLFVRSLSTQLFFLVFLLLLLLSMIAFSYVGFLSLFWVRLFFPQVFPEPSSTQHFSWVVVFWAVCRAWIRSVVSFFSSGLFFGLPVFRGSVHSNFQGCFVILKKIILSRVCSKTFLSLVILLISAVQNASFFLFQLFKRLSFQGCFVILSSFFRVCSKTFLSLVIVLI